MINTCRREGVEIRLVPAEYTTATCHVCGTAEVWDQAAHVMHRCGQCGALWDQDHNAAINLLARGKVALTENQRDTEGIPPLSGDRSQEGPQGVGESRM